MITIPSPSPGLSQTSPEWRRVAGLISRATGRPVDGSLIIRRLRSLNNRAYRVDLGSESLVVRLPGGDADPNRAIEIRNAAAAASLGLSAETLFTDPADGVLITRWIDPGTPLTLPVGRSGLEQIGRILARLHAGPALQGRFDPVSGLAERVARECAEPPRSATHAITLSQLRGVRGALSSICRMLSTDTHFPVHGDPTPGNWIDAGSHLVLIDWEYSGMGDPLWDLAEFSVTASLTPAQERVLWEAHQGEIRTPDAGAAPYPTAHHRDHLRLWKIVCDVVGSVWALDRARGDDPEDVGADLVRYAHRRAERAATALAGPVAETSLRALT